MVIEFKDWKPERYQLPYGRKEVLVSVTSDLIGEPIPLPTLVAAAELQLLMDTPPRNVDSG